MSTHTTYEEWLEYQKRERAWLEPYLARLDIELEVEQPHVSGERFFMQAVTTASGRKLILLGKRTTDGARVVVKATSDPDGIRELTHAHTCRATLHHIGFAYDMFHSPEEIHFESTRDRCVSVQRFIPQSCAFLERTIEEQFSYALASFKAQERAHATTHSHLREVRGVFATYTTPDYLETFDAFLAPVAGYTHDTTPLARMRSARAHIAEPDTIERYCGFLTHTDFVPHNFRIHDGVMYLLDHSSLRFGNKHESWARFLNFMTLYHPALEQALLQYVRDNRAPEEYASLTLIRMYRLGELIRYYVRACEMTEGDLNTLNHARVRFWADVLEAVLENRPLSDTIRTEYTHTRDALRSGEEKKRQVGLH
ncbi:MAG: hypothetical protein KBD21_04455 [Candidatus Pacebacteria bacterium]|nr:hypothetical protein [Candidatus Paceibacterota bacterium]